MKISLLDCEEYKEFFSENYPELGPSYYPSQFEVRGDGVSYCSKENGEYFVQNDGASPSYRREFELLKRLFPEAFL